VAGLVDLVALGHIRCANPAGQSEPLGRERKAWAKRVRSSRSCPQFLPRPSGKSPAFLLVIRCLTIATEDAPSVTIATELIMPGRPTHYLDEQLKHLTASLFGVETRP
jgi:hypothetical protein